METNVFWTGGFDSTFRLLELVESQELQIINLYYIALEIDNKIGSYIKRNSIEIELKTMSKILKLINTNKIKTFNIIGNTENLINCHFIFNFHFMNYIQKEYIEYSDSNRSNFENLYNNFLVLRPICQWGAITQILEDSQINAEICIEKGGGFWNRFQNYINQNNHLDIDESIGMNAFLRYKLPLINLDREYMIEKSQNNNWLEILRQTWSCWYPENGKECGFCFAAKEELFNLF